MVESSQKERRYDQWAGNPEGILEDKTRCIAEVRDFTGWHLVQCSRKRGYGPNGEYCKQHAKKFHVQGCADPGKSVAPFSNRMKTPKNQKKKGSQQ